MGIDDATGNYIAYASNPDVGPYIGYGMTSPDYGMAFNATLERAQQKLEEVFNTTGMGIVDLFYNLSIS